MKTALLSIFAFFAFSLTAQNHPIEVAKIKECLAHYIEGTANGQPERLEIAFHPDFNLYSIKNDSLSVWKGQDYIAGITPGKKNSREGSILSVDQSGNVATAKVQIIIPGWRNFTDYMLLAKYQGQWKIIHKSFSWVSLEEKE